MKEKGTVKWYNATKKYGFITPDVGEKDIYVHASQIETLSQKLEEGERVEYEVQPGRKGPEAHHVNTIDAGQ